MKKNEAVKIRLDEWVQNKGYLNSRLTIIQLSKIIGINRTYLSNHINKTYGLNFNLWLNHLRIEEAKKNHLAVACPQLSRNCRTSRLHRPGSFQQTVQTA